MRVKIGNTYYDSEQEPIMVEFLPFEKEKVKIMDNDDMKMCCFPEYMTYAEIAEFMDISFDKEKYEKARKRMNEQIEE